jgi:hypothetical protein
MLSAAVGRIRGVIGARLRFLQARYDAAATGMELRPSIDRLESTWERWQGQEHERMAALRQEVAELRAAIADLREVLQLIYEEEPANRRRLYELRTAAEYERAYTEPAPLVSVVIPTYDRVHTLVERALPSALAQTYTNIEIVVVGDGAPVETAEAIAELRDERIAFSNLNRRGPYPEDPQDAWFVVGTPPFNEAVRRARGRWIAPLDDDDAFRPHHIARLLETARRDRLEVCCGVLEAHLPDGRRTPIGAFPPRRNQFGLQATLYHSGLRFFELELADSLFRQPNDWGLCRRWLRVGVRMGFIDEVTADYYPNVWGGERQIWRDERATGEAERRSSTSG